MHPAIPLATQVMSEHTATLVQFLEKRAELGYGLQLAGMLRQVISQTTASITEKQIEAILMLTRQTHEALSNNLEHYMVEREKFSGQYLNTTDPLSRAEMTAHINNIDDRMKAIRRDMEALHHFSAQIISICGEAGLNFVQQLSIPYSQLRIG